MLILDAVETSTGVDEYCWHVFWFLGWTETAFRYTIVAKEVGAHDGGGSIVGAVCHSLFEIMNSGKRMTMNE